jgi:hypothetical protein
MDELTLAICVAVLLLIVSHWVTYALGRHTGKATALTWANSIATAILKKVED